MPIRADSLSGEEVFNRIRKARKQMYDLRLDALLLFTGPNLVYFTGMPCGRSGSRPYAYLLPYQGEPVLIVHSGRQYEAKRFTSNADIRTYASLSHLPLPETMQVLDERNLLSGRIGIEYANEMVLDIPQADYLELISSTPRVEWIDASGLLWYLRQVKSVFEVECIRQACEITTFAYEQTFKAIRAGMSERQIEQLMLKQLIEQGGYAPWLVITSGPGNYDLVSKGGADRIVEPGDMVWMDGGCSVQGYWSDFSRAGVVGGPSVNQIEAQSLIVAITCLGLGMIKPGVPVHEIAEACQQQVDTLGLPVTSSISGLAGRVGHGLGLQITELPSINRVDQTILEAGMIVTIEPGVATDYGTFHVEQNVLVTDDGAQNLSDAPWDLWSISE